MFFVYVYKAFLILTMCTRTVYNVQCAYININISYIYGYMYYGYINILNVCLYENMYDVHI